MKTNEYLEKKSAEWRTFEDARAERTKERDALKEAGDWDGVKAFDEKEKKDFPVPYTQGECKAYRAYKQSREKELDFLEAEDLPWDYEAEDFINLLRKAGFTEMIITDQSTDLMNLLFAFKDQGCRIGSLEIRQGKDWCGRDTEIKGIQMFI